MLYLGNGFVKGESVGSSETKSDVEEYVTTTLTCRFVFGKTMSEEARVAYLMSLTATGKLLADQRTSMGGIYAEVLRRVETARGYIGALPPASIYTVRDTTLTQVLDGGVLRGSSQIHVRSVLGDSDDAGDRITLALWGELERAHPEEVARIDRTTDAILMAPLMWPDTLERGPLQGKLVRVAAAFFVVSRASDVGGGAPVYDRCTAFMPVGFMHCFLSCNKCGSQAHLSGCGRCISAFYCSKKCQSDSWREHKLHCDERVSRTGVANAVNRTYDWDRMDREGYFVLKWK